MAHPTRRTALKTMAVSTTTIPLPFLRRQGTEGVAGPVRFGVVADLHIGFVEGAGKRLDTFLEAMKAGPHDALIQLGDFAYPNPEHQQFADRFNASHDVVLHAIGNHDLDHGLTKDQCVAAWRMPGRYYARHINGLHILVLDGNDKGSPTRKSGYPSYIGSEQREWLETQLKESQNPVLVISHQPLAGRSAIDNGAEIQDLLSRFRDRILFCMNGHSHVDSCLNLQGVNYLHINSASYYWLGGTVRMAHYKDPLFAEIVIDLQQKLVTIHGRKSEWNGDSPEDVGYFDGKNAELREIVTPQIRTREIRKT